MKLFRGLIFTVLITLHAHGMELRSSFKRRWNGETVKTPYNSVSLEHTKKAPAIRVQKQLTKHSYDTLAREKLPPKKRLRTAPPIHPRTILGLRYIWNLPAINNALVSQIMEKHQLSKLVAQTLVARGYSVGEEIESFIHPSYEKDVHNASLLKDADKTVSRITQAIQKKEPILICGDYDADGMTSSALLIHCLEPLGAQISWHIPNRRDGYGIKANTVEEASKEGYKVLITVDNGTTAFEAAQKAKECGIDLIITDHHLVHEGLPDAYAFVNPNQPGCQYPFKSLAGVGVAFKLMSLLYEKNHLELPEKTYELMMLGTIADVVPLVGENRFWVRFGLDYINRTKGSISFQKLRKNSKIEKPRLDSIDIAFNITPQLNALGRLDDANLGVQFLLDDNANEVEDIGNAMHELNQRRKEIQMQMFNEVKNRIKSHEIDLRNDHLIILSSPDWHLGINGLVASRAVEYYYKPTIIFQETENEDGEIILKGSGRSISSFNLFDALTRCKDLLIASGGHKYAAGLTLKKENLEAFKKRLEHIFIDTVKKSDTYHRHSIDTVADLQDLNPRMIQDFEELEPFGSENPPPTLLFNDVHVAKNPTFMGRGHVKCALASGGVERSVKFFFRPEMYYRFKELQEKPFQLIGHPDDNYWNGKRNIEIKGLDINKQSSPTYH